LDFGGVPAFKGANEKTKPLAVIDYNKYKINVDKFSEVLEFQALQICGESGRKSYQKCRDWNQRAVT
jgi:hypothetical protein